MVYRFVAGIDYGQRRGTLGLAIHMAEGGDGTVGYLAQHGGESRDAWIRRVRGVSANFVILSTGEIVQMVGWAKASGSMNPYDRGDTAGFYRREFIVEVLGIHYQDPNAWSLSVEITGYRKQGPNRQQVDALYELVRECRRRFPNMVGAYGHADQTDTKGCPGTAPLMMEAWNTIGHGEFRKDVDMDLYATGGRFRSFPKGTPVFDKPGGAQTGTITDDHKVYRLTASDEKVVSGTLSWFVIDGGGDGKMAWVKAIA